MSPLHLITISKEEFQLVARELGERLAPFFLPPNKMDVIRIDLSGESGVGKSAFQLAMAEVILFDTPLTRPAKPNDELAYSRISSTSAGATRQAIFVDSKGLDFSIQKLAVPERVAPGPLFVQHPEFDELLDTANAAKIDMTTHVGVKLQRYGREELAISVTLNLPQFPMARFVQRLTDKGIITPPRKALTYEGAR